MDISEAAAALDGNEYGSEGSPGLFAKMKAANLVALFGYSDDNIELRGAEFDEVGVGDTTVLCFDQHGVLRNDCVNEQCPYFREIMNHAAKINVTSPGPDGGMFGYSTMIRHAPFKIMEDGDFYSAGIVISLDDLP